MSYKKFKAPTMVLMALLAMNIVFLGNVVLTNANISSEETVVYVHPPEIIGLMSPETFTIDVKIANVTDLFGLDLQFGWDPTIIQYVSHTAKIPVETYPDGILHQPPAGIWVHNDVDETASMPGSEPGTTYWLAYASFAPAAPFEGDGIAFNMTFEVVGVGSCPLKITGSVLADSGGDPIDHEVIDGYFSNYIPTVADIFVDPPTIVNSSLGPCHNFTVSVNITGVENLYSFDFLLSYNATLLEINEVTGNPTFPPATIVYDTGQVEVSASLVPPAPPISGDWYLASIEFHILAEGESILDLHDVSILDDKGESITYNEPGDGYFNNMLISKISAMIEIEPGVLNLKSKGRWITAYIEVPEGYDVNNINVSTIMLNDTVPIDLKAPTEVGDYDNDTIADLMVKFNRTELIEYILPQFTECGDITLTVTGKLYSDMSFEGSDTIKVSILVGDANCDGVVDILDIVTGSISYDCRDEELNWNANVNFALPYEKIDIFDLVTAAAHYGETC